MFISKEVVVDCHHVPSYTKCGLWACCMDRSWEDVGNVLIEIQAAPLSMTSESRGGRLRDFQALRRVVMRNKVALCRALLKVLSLHRFIL